MISANFRVLFTSDDIVVIKDIGPWSVFATVTNSVENVVSNLAYLNVIKNTTRLFYIDSDNYPGEILLSHMRYNGFAPVALNEADGANAMTIMHAAGAIDALP